MSTMSIKPEPNTDPSIPMSEQLTQRYGVSCSPSERDIVLAFVESNGYEIVSDKIELGVCFLSFTVERNGERMLKQFSLISNALFAFAKSQPAKNELYTLSNPNYREALDALTATEGCTPETIDSHEFIELGKAFSYLFCDPDGLKIDTSLPELRGGYEHQIKEGTFKGSFSDYVIATARELRGYSA